MCLHFFVHDEKEQTQRLFKTWKTKASLVLRQSWMLRLRVDHCGWFADAWYLCARRWIVSFEILFLSVFACTCLSESLVCLGGIWFLAFDRNLRHWSAVDSKDHEIFGFLIWKWMVVNFLFNYWCQLCRVFL